MKHNNLYFGASLLAVSSIATACNGPTDGTRPNIIVILTDDMGYSDLGCYGGEIETPNIDALACNGLRWTQFYNNARSCPSRACLMTGLYPHQTGMGWMACADEQTPAYRGTLNHNCVTLAEVLGSAGYETYMVGKWHLCSEQQCSGEVLESWPVQRGFRHFYGIPEGASHYFRARMVSGETRLPKTEDKDRFYITDAISDSAAVYVQRHDYSEKPLFLYYAFNAPHWPLHAHPEIIAKYKERYRRGWDVLREERLARQKEMGLFPDATELSGRDSKVPAWDSLSNEEQNEFVNRMSIYAAQIDAIDKGVGNLVQALKDAGQFENTIILMMDDNGACAESLGNKHGDEIDGGPDTYESYRINWANLSSTPYREYKHYTNEGGIATPLIVSWPKGIKKELNGSFVRNYGYFTDIMATCVELADATYPTEFNGHQIYPMEGVSLVPEFNGKKSERGMTFWEHEGNIAVRDGKWKLVVLNREGEKINLNNFELYDMEKDPVELNNLATKYHEKVQMMFSEWDKWAKRVGAYPICNDGYGYRAQGSRRFINGTFDDNFGHWNLHAKNTGVKFSIDNTIQGKTAHIEINERGSRPGEAAMIWRFPARDSRKTSISFQYKSDKTNHLWLRLENVKNPGAKDLDKKIALSEDGGTISLSDIPIKAGQKQLCFYVGDSLEGNIWIDNITMKLE